MDLLAAFLRISVTIQPLLFVYHECCQAFYMHLTNDHLILQTTGGKRTFLWFVFLCHDKKKKKKKETKGNLRFFTGIPWHFYDMPTEQHQRTVTIGKTTALLYGDRAKGRLWAFARRGFNHITIKRFIFFPLLLVHTNFSSKNDIFLFMNHPEPTRGKFRKPYGPSLAC